MAYYSTLQSSMPMHFVERWLSYKKVLTTYITLKRLLIFPQMWPRRLYDEAQYY